MPNKYTVLALCLIAWLFLIPLLLLPGLIFSVLLAWRIVVDVLAAFFHPDWLPVYPPDTAQTPVVVKSRVYTSNKGKIRVEKCGNNISAVVAVKEEVSLSELRQTFKDKLLNIRTEDGKSWKNIRFQMIVRQFLGFLYWAPAKNEVDLKKHIWEHKSNDGTPFEDFVNSYNMRGFEDRPQWEIIISRPAKGIFSGSTAIVFKVNHGLADAIAVIRIIETLCNMEVPMEVKKMKLTWGQTLFQAIVFPWVAFKLMTLPKHKLPAGADSKGFVQAFTTFDVELIKRTARSAHKPFREIVTTTLLSAVRRFMLESVPIKDLPKHLPGTIVLPALYYTRSFELLANRATICSFSYPMRPESALQRLEIAHADIVENLTCGQNRFFIWISYLMYIIPTWVWKNVPFGTFLSIVAVDIRSSTSKKLALFGKYDLSDEGYSFVTPETGGISGIFMTMQNTATFTLFVSKLFVPTNEAAARVCTYFQQELESLCQESVNRNWPASAQLPLLTSNV